MSDASSKPSGPSLSPSPSTPATLSPGSAGAGQKGPISPIPPSSSNSKLDSIPEHIKVPAVAETQTRTSRTGSISFATPQPPRISRALPKRTSNRARRSSPPAATRFKHHVSFDNFTGGEPTDNNTVALTLNVKHTGYQYKKRSRTFMVGIDENDYSNYALKWMLDELVDDGDEIICVRVVDKDAKISSDKSVEKKQYQEEAKLLMRSIQAKNDEHRAISIVLEFAVGKLHTTFQKMIQLYEPAMLVVGTKGRSLGGFQGLVANRNSFSKWCLQYSPIPVVVVRPDEKREKKRLKRAADPTRRNYEQILRDSGAITHEADAGSGGDIKNIDTLPPNAPDIEAHAVAAALGLPARFDPTLKPFIVESGQVSRKVSSDKSDATKVPCESGSNLHRPSSRRLVRKDTRDMLVETPAVTEGKDENEDEELEDEEDEEEEEEDDDDDEEDEEEGEFETIPDHELLGNDPEMKKKLHQMEVGEAAALAGRKGSIGSIDSGISASGAGEDLEKV